MKKKILFCVLMLLFIPGFIASCGEEGNIMPDIDSEVIDNSITGVKGNDSAVVDAKKNEITLTTTKSTFNVSSIETSANIEIKAYSDEKCENALTDLLALTNGTNTFYLKMTFGRATDIWKLIITKNKVESKLEIKEMVTEYEVGETFKGGTLIYTTESSSKDVTITEEMVTGFDTKTEGNKTLTITYEGKTIEVVINVKAPKVTIELSIKEMVKEYQVGEAFKGGILNVKKDGTLKEIEITEEMVTGFDTTTEGKKTLTITYEGKTIEVLMNVIAFDEDALYKVVASVSALQYNHFEKESFLKARDTAINILKTKDVDVMPMVEQLINEAKISNLTLINLNDLIENDLLEAMPTIYKYFYNFDGAKLLGINATEIQALQKLIGAVAAKLNFNDVIRFGFVFRDYAEGFDKENIIGDFIKAFPELESFFWPAFKHATITEEESERVSTFAKTLLAGISKLDANNFIKLIDFFKPAVEAYNETNQNDMMKAQYKRYLKIANVVNDIITDLLANTNNLKGLSEVGNIVIDWYNRAYPIKDLNQVDKTKDLKKILDFAERQLPNLKVVFETITPEAIDEIVDLQFYAQEYMEASSNGNLTPEEQAHIDEIGINASKLIIKYANILNELVEHFAKSNDLENLQIIINLVLSSASGSNISYLNLFDLALPVLKTITSIKPEAIDNHTAGIIINTFTNVGKDFEKNIVIYEPQNRACVIKANSTIDDLISLLNYKFGVHIYVGNNSYLEFTKENLKSYIPMLEEALKNQGLYNLELNVSGVKLDIELYVAGEDLKIYYDVLEASKPETNVYVSKNDKTQLIAHGKSVEEYYHFNSLFGNVIIYDETRHFGYKVRLNDMFAPNTMKVEVVYKGADSRGVGLLKIDTVCGTYYHPVYVNVVDEEQSVITDYEIRWQKKPYNETEPIILVPGEDVILYLNNGYNIVNLYYEQMIKLDENGNPIYGIHDQTFEFNGKSYTVKINFYNPEGEEIILPTIINISFTPKSSDLGNYQYQSYNNNYLPGDDESLALILKNYDGRVDFNYNPSYLTSDLTEFNKIIAEKFGKGKENISFKLSFKERVSETRGLFVYEMLAGEERLLAFEFEENLQNYFNRPSNYLFKNYNILLNDDVFDSLANMTEAEINDFMLKEINKLSYKEINNYVVSEEKTNLIDALKQKDILISLQVSKFVTNFGDESYSVRIFGDFVEIKFFSIYRESDNQINNMSIVGHDFHDEFHIDLTEEIEEITLDFILSKLELLDAVGLEYTLTGFKYVDGKEALAILKESFNISFENNRLIFRSKTGNNYFGIRVYVNKLTLEKPLSVYGPANLKVLENIDFLLDKGLSIQELNGYYHSQILNKHNILSFKVNLEDDNSQYLVYSFEVVIKASESYDRDRQFKSIFKIRKLAKEDINGGLVFNDIHTDDPKSITSDDIKNAMVINIYTNCLDQYHHNYVVLPLDYDKIFTNCEFSLATKDYGNVKIEVKSIDGTELDPAIKELFSYRNIFISSTPVKKTL